MLTPAAFKQRLDFRVVDLLGAFLAAEGVDEDEQSLGPACGRNCITEVISSLAGADLSSLIRLKAGTVQIKTGN